MKEGGNLGSTVFFFFSFRVENVTLDARDLLNELFSFHFVSLRRPTVGLRYNDICFFMTCLCFFNSPNLPSLIPSFITTFTRGIARKKHAYFESK